MAKKKLLEVLIDANALFHLSQIEINRQKADKWLWKYLQILTCPAVKKEFSKKINFRTPTERSVLKKLVKTKRSVPKTRRTSRLEKNWLHPEYYKKNLDDQDKGERHLMCMAVEIVKEKKYGQIVVVTDDFSAQEYFMDSLIEDIRFGQIWNTPDLLTYLFFVNDNISLENIENAIQDIIAIESMSWKKFRKKGDRQEDAMVKMRTHYVKRLRKIHFLRQKYHS